MVQSSRQRVRSFATRASAALVLLASERSAGTVVDFRGGELTVRAVSPEAFDGVDVAIAIQVSRGD